MSQNSSVPQHRVSRARSRSPISRPTTPLRPSSRSSFRSSQNNGHVGSTALDALEPQFAELSDSMADLEANFMHLQLMHESLSRFGESFASFLYGLNMNAFVVDFPEQPIAESIKRWQKQQRNREQEDTSTIIQGGTNKHDTAETTFMTNDTSFASMKTTPRRRTMNYGEIPTTKTSSNATVSNTTTTRKSSIPSVARGSTAGRGTRGSTRGTRGSSLPTRGRGRGIR